MSIKFLALFVMTLLSLVSGANLVAWEYCDTASATNVSQCAALTTKGYKYKCCLLKVIYVCTAVNINFKVNNYTFNAATVRDQCPTLNLTPLNAQGASNLVAGVLSIAASMYLMA